MNIQTALLPHKHTRFCDSIIALAGFIRTLLAEPKTIDEVWALVDHDNSSWLSRPRFEAVVYAIDTLYALKQIEALDENGRIRIRSTA